MIIIRTNAETIDAVVENEKHALKSYPRQLSNREIILISQTKKTLPFNKKPIQYLMEFVKCNYDSDKESIEIWGSFWPYIIVGKNCRELKNPFDICKVLQKPYKNYGQGGTIVYVDPRDEEYLQKHGYLE